MELFEQRDRNIDIC